MASNSQADPSPETRQAQFEQGVALSLHLWLPLTIAVQNHWGGPSSSDKRDWLAGAVADMFPSFVDLAAASNNTTTTTTNNNSNNDTGSRSSTKAKAKAKAEDPLPEDVEATLLQVMWDEFEANVDDESEVEVADRVVRVRAACAAGSFDLVEDLRSRWLATKGKKVVVEEKVGGDGDQETDWESDDDDDDEDDEGDSDVDMGEAPALVAAPKEKPPPEVDEDGFTTVTRKKR